MAKKKRYKVYLLFREFLVGTEQTTQDNSEIQ